MTGGTVRLAQLDVSGATTLNSATIETSGHQIYNGAVALTGDSTLSALGTSIDFGATLDGAYGLTVDAGGGSVNFVGRVGGVTPLASLDVTGGAISLPSTVATTGAPDLWRPGAAGRRHDPDGLEGDGRLDRRRRLRPGHRRKRRVRQTRSEAVRRSPA